MQWIKKEWRRFSFIFELLAARRKASRTNSTFGFFADTQANAKKAKELFFPNAPRLFINSEHKIIEYLKTLIIFDINCQV